VDRKPRVAVALVHYPIKNRKGETSATAITSMDVHDFCRTCAFYDVGPIYFVHPSAGMHAMVKDITDYWLEGEGGARNPGRREVLQQLRMVDSLEEAIDDFGGSCWYTSATPPAEHTQPVSELMKIEGRHLIVFGTGWGLDEALLPEPFGWLSPIEGTGMVRHLSVRAALSIYLDRLSLSLR
jgi:hypothetical protein